MHRFRGVAVLGCLGLAACGGGEEVDRFARFASESMEPTYQVGDVARVDSKPESVEVGDVVIFHPPKGVGLNTCGARHSSRQACPKPTRGQSEVEFLKRIVAEGGDRVSIRGGIVHIDGRRQPEEYARGDDSCPTCNLPRPITVPAGHFFVMGDNRAASADSREWGPIPEGSITGRVVGVAKEAGS